MELILAVIWAAAGIGLILLEILICQRLRPGKEDGGRERPIPPEAGEEARLRRPAPGSIDEGFENLMTYSADGKTGFEELRGGAEA